VIIAYDYFLTLSDEVAFFWSRRGRLRFFSFFFFLNRYVSLVGHIPIVVISFLDQTDPAVRGPASSTVHCFASESAPL
jgi:hypothetical protein